MMAKYSSYSEGGARQWLKWVLFAAGFAALAYLIWYATEQRDALSSPDTPERIAAPDSPLKERATEPGGMDIPNRDKRVFDLLAEDNQTGEEDVVPKVRANGDVKCRAEGGSVVCDSTVKDAPAVKAAPSPQVAGQETEQATADEGGIGALIRETEAEAEQAAEAVAETTEEATAESVTAAVNEAADMVAKAGATTANVAENIAEETAEAAAAATEDVADAVTPAAAQQVPAGSWGVQLASYRSPNEAAQAINTFTSQFPALLNDLTPHVEEKAISDRGTFYRVQFFGTEGKDAARDVCRALKERGQGCLYIQK